MGSRESDSGLEFFHGTLASISERVEGGEDQAKRGKMLKLV